MRRLWRNTLRIGVVLACVTGVHLAMSAPAQAAFATELSGLPDRFTAGGRVETVSAVVSRSDQGGCIKVRWSMVVGVQGVRLDQVRIDRIEENGSFPVQVRTEGNAARLTDRQLDPGTLCPGRTVTAQYRIAFARDADQGQVQLAVEAYDQNLQLLSRQTATRDVVGGRGAAGPTVAPTPTEVTPTESPRELEPQPTEDPPEEGPGERVDAGAAGGGAAAPDAGAAGNISQTGAGLGLTEVAFLLGGLLLFLGVGLLMRLRQLTKEPEPVSADGVSVSAADRWERQPGPRQRWRTVPRDGGRLG
ncbi:hypothetical protein ABT008_11090 [Micromonospora sp. NPDC002389]|uniref:hypothetical protein n=1 Tax=Micromonospora sp. NPDC002389 TaxID=3154272 RepID=UPI00331A55F7